MAHRFFRLPVCACVALLLLCLRPLATTGATLTRQEAQRMRHSKNYKQRRLKQLPVAFPLITAQRGASLPTAAPAVASAGAFDGRRRTQQQQARTLRSTVHTGTSNRGRATLSTTNCFPIAFLQKTHVVTARFLESAKRAKEQVERCGGYYRVLLTDPRDRATRQQDTAHSNPAMLTAPGSNRVVGAAALRLLQEALGPGGVVVVGSDELAQLFGENWTRHVQANEQPKFMWVHCDAPEVVWFHRHGWELPPSIDRVWVAEYDVGWTGDVVQDIFASFPKEADFICSIDFKADIGTGPGWVHFGTRTWMKDDQVRQCFVMLVRYSVRLLSLFQAETLQQHTQFCEISGASMCAMHPEWCSIHTFNLSSAIVGKNADGVGRYHYLLAIDQEEWRKTEEKHRAGGNPPGVYHALKW